MKRLSFMLRSRRANSPAGLPHALWALMLGNLFRDQLDRYGELETIAEDMAGLKPCKTVDGDIAAVSAAVQLVRGAALDQDGDRLVHLVAHHTPGQRANHLLRFSHA